MISSKNPVSNIQTDKKVKIPVDKRKRQRSRNFETKLKDLETVIVQRKPQQPKHAYSCYLTHNIARIHQNGTHLHLPMESYVESMRVCGYNWKSMSDEEQKPYHKMAQEDYYRNIKEMKEFKQTGYFTNSNGVNTSTLPPKIKYKNWPSGRRGRSKNDETRYFRLK